MGFFRGCCSFLTGAVVVVAFVLRWLQRGLPYASEFEGYEPQRKDGSWAGVHTVPLANATAELIRDYMMRRTPLLLTDVDSSKWSWARLQQACPSVVLDFKNHYYGPLLLIESIEVIRRFFDWQLRRTFGDDVSVRSLIEAMKKRWRLADFLEHLKRQSPPRSYRRISDYLWPLTVHSVVLDYQKEKCRQFLEEMKASIDPLTQIIPIPPRLTKDVVNLAELFIAPNASRAYPLHQHGVLNENFIYVLSGEKRVWIFPPSADAMLDERPEYQVNEFADRIFMADPTSRIDGVRGVECVVRAGQIVYLPANSIHLLQNSGDVISVAYHIAVQDLIPKESWRGYIEERKPVPGGRTGDWQWQSSHLRSWPERVAASLARGSIFGDALRSP